MDGGLDIQLRMETIRDGEVLDKTAPTWVTHCVKSDVHSSGDSSAQPGMRIEQPSSPLALGERFASLLGVKLMNFGHNWIPESI